MSTKDDPALANIRALINQIEEGHKSYDRALAAGDQEGALRYAQQAANVLHDHPEVVSAYLSFFDRKAEEHGDGDEDDGGLGDDGDAADEERILNL